MYLSSKNIKRFHCILASPLLVMSAISNFYFFGGESIGNIFIYNIIYGKFLIFLVFYIPYILSCLIYRKNKLIITCSINTANIYCLNINILFY